MPFDTQIAAINTNILLDKGYSNVKCWSEFIFKLFTLVYQIDHFNFDVIEKMIIRHRSVCLAR